VDPTVQVLLDERDITRLCHRYATALDTGDWPLLRTCFLPDAVAVYEGIGEQPGYDAIEALCRSYLAPLTQTQHLIGNVEVVVDGDTATAHCYLQAQHVRTGAEGGDLFVIAGRYSDELVRTPDGWRIARRALASWWTAGNPAVVGG
jgi:ketosteroid isomerase-like protein